MITDMAGHPSPRDQASARQARLVAIVLVGTMALWLGAQWMGGRLGLPVRFVFLFDFAAVAAFVWALVVSWRLWRQRRD